MDPARSGSFAAAQTKVCYEKKSPKLLDAGNIKKLLFDAAMSGVFSLFAGIKDKYFFDFQFKNF